MLYVAKQQSLRSNDVINFASSRPCDLIQLPNSFNFGQNFNQAFNESTDDKMLLPRVGYSPSLLRTCTDKMSADTAKRERYDLGASQEIDAQNRLLFALTNERKLLL